MCYHSGHVCFNTTFTVGALMFTFQSTENYEASIFLSKKISNQPFAERAFDKLSALLLHHRESHSHTPQTFYIKTWVSEFVFKSFPTILVTASEFIYVIVSLFHVCHLTIPLFPVDSSIYFKFWFDLLSMTMYCYQKSLDISSTPVYLLPTNSAIVRK